MGKRAERWTVQVNFGLGWHNECSFTKKDSRNPQARAEANRAEFEHAAKISGGSWRARVIHEGGPQMDAPAAE